jgi:hypothetical protein
MRKGIGKIAYLGWFYGVSIAKEFKTLIVCVILILEDVK